MHLISVIIPVYNAEKYLSECVESVLGQTYKNVEVILVDDGSPDNCPALCDAYAKKDPRVRVIHKANGGVSSARNAGIRVAVGEYVHFIDSDDWISEDMYEILMDASENGTIDFLLCDFERFYPDGHTQQFVQSIRSGVYNRTQMEAELFPKLVMDGAEFPPSISNCVCLIRRRLLVEHQVFYREDIRISEDAPFGSEALYCANSFAYLKGKALYHYRQWDDSRSKSYHSWWWEHYLKINEETEQFFGHCPEYDFSQQIKSNMFYFARAEVYYILQDNQLSRKEQNKKIRAVMNHPRVVRMLKGYDVSGLPLSYQMVYYSLYWRSVTMRRMISVVSEIRHRKEK